MLAAGAIQGIGALTGGLTITDAAGLATRAMIALATETALSAGTVAYLHTADQHLARADDLPTSRRPGLSIRGAAVRLPVAGQAEEQS
jgi:hypothetical protein